MNATRKNQDRRQNRNNRQTVSENNLQQKPITLQIPVYEVLTATEVELIHQKSLEVLGEVGIVFFPA